MGLKGVTQPTVHHQTLQVVGNVLGLVLLGDVEETVLVKKASISPFSSGKQSTQTARKVATFFLVEYLVVRLVNAFAIVALPISGSQIIAKLGDELKKMCRFSALTPSVAKIPFNALNLLLKSFWLNDILRT